MPFCEMCGTEVGETDAFCWNCGADLRGSDVAAGSSVSSISATQEAAESQNPYSQTEVEPQYSTPISWEEENTPYGSVQSFGASASDALNKATDVVSDVASDVMKRASGAFEQAKSTVGDVASRASFGQSAAAKTPAPSAPAAAVVEKRHSNMQKHMSKNDLWTWLKKDDRRKLFFLEDRDAPTQDEYMQLLVEKINANEVPASIVHRPIRWDMSEVKSDEYLVQPYTSAVNPLTCCLKFAQVGKFCFVEQKTFLAPPNLPSAPGKKLAIPDVSTAKHAMLIGAIMALVGIFSMMSSCSASSSSYARSAMGGVSAFGFIALLIGGGLFYWGYTKSNIKSIIEHNKKVDEETRLWNQAWEDWENSVFVHSFQEASNGQVTRVYQAVFDCMRQINDELFRDAASSEERDDNSMNDLREQIAQRKDNYR